MSSLVVVRFPAGAAEYRLGNTPPKVGDTLTRNGDEWVVVTVEEQRDGTTAVELRPKEATS